jgi:hypothetical protein
MFAIIRDATLDIHIMILPHLQQSQKVTLIDIKPKQHFTEPPPFCGSTYAVHGPEQEQPPAGT